MINYSPHIIAILKQSHESSGLINQFCQKNRDIVVLVFMTLPKSFQSCIHRGSQ